MVYKFENNDCYLETIEFRQVFDEEKSEEFLQIVTNVSGVDSVIFLNKSELFKLIGALHCIQKDMK